MNPFHAIEIDEHVEYEIGIMDCVYASLIACFTTGCVICAIIAIFAIFLGLTCYIF